MWPSLFSSNTPLIPTSSYSRKISVTANAFSEDSLEFNFGFFSIAERRDSIVFVEVEVLNLAGLDGNTDTVDLSDEPLNSVAGLGGTEGAVDEDAV